MTPEQIRSTLFARAVLARAGVRNAALEHALAAVPRERFAGPGPWHLWTADGYALTPDANPDHLYGDVVVALDKDKRINIGEPSYHMRCLNALAVRPGETALHVGGGVGYYTSILAELVGPAGRVVSFEVEPHLVARARQNLAERRNVEIRLQSGSEGPLPMADVIYVNAGATHPLALWRDALRPGGRLMFPLTGANGNGGMLRIARTPEGWDARFICLVGFYPCVGVRDEALAAKLERAFDDPQWWAVQSLHVGTPPERGACWIAGDGWWLSKHALRKAA
jgi:protein-L-isoaspartate(D-aspartate) O-methyltransferase